MTSPDPEIADLLRTARETLKSDVLPRLAEPDRYPALMVLNALAIALRRHGHGPERDAAALAALAAFAPGADDLAAARRAIARRLRAEGAAAESPALHAALTTAARLATEESNPRASALAAVAR